MPKPKWEKIDHNEALNYPDFFISYLKPPEYGVAPTLDVFTRLGALVGIDTRVEETAIVIHKDGKHIYAILNGDWRKEYEALGDDLEACLAFYAAKKGEFMSDWSTYER